MTGTHRPLARFFGALLTAAGGLIAATAGVCTARFVGDAVMAGFSGDGSAAAVILIELFVGAIPLAIGLALVFAGLRLFRGSARPGGPGAGPGARL